MKTYNIVSKLHGVALAHLRNLTKEQVYDFAEVHCSGSGEFAIDRSGSMNAAVAPDYYVVECDDAPAEAKGGAS